MPSRHPSRTLASIVMAVAFTALATSNVLAAGKEKVLHAFNGKKGGSDSYSSLTFDSAGNLYGTTQRGGDLSVCDGAGCGVVFELSPEANGKWKETVLYTFAGGKDGGFPSAGLIFDPTGNLYGTTELGGNTSAPICQESGCGVVFKLTPTNGHWQQSVLHRFNGKNGSTPISPLTFDASGCLYGTTVSGGDARGDGVVFKLAPDSSGRWKETVLHRFTNGEDGALPFAGVIFDKNGNLYGTTDGGGDLPDCNGFGCGVVFQLTPGTNGKWKQTVLHTFTGGQDGSTPFDLAIDSTGNLYGTTNSGGKFGNGTAFQLSPSAGGEWKKTLLHSFGAPEDGGGPGAGLILDTAGNLYGTTIFGGKSCGGGCGIVFKLAPSSSGHWKEHILYSFQGANDGGGPGADLVIDSKGNLYGTTPGGGAHQAGVVFKVSQ